MTFAALKTEVFRRLEEAEASPLFFSEADVEDALNEGYAEVSDETEWYEIWRTIDVLASRPYYELRYVISDVEVLTPGRAFNDTTNRWLTPSSTRDLDATYNRWERVTGTAQRVQTRGLWFAGYWPIMTSATGTIKQYATALPTALSDDTDEPGFDEVFHLGLVEYALALLWPQMGEVSRALQAWTAYLTFEGALGDTVAGRGAVPHFGVMRPS